MITLIWRTDTHLSDRTPQSRTDNWTDTVLGKLKQVGEIAKAENAAAVLDGGDFFDVKSPARNSHRLIRKVADIHREYPCPVYATVGNHDCVYGDINFLDQQPLGVLFSTGVFQRLYHQYEVYFNEMGIYPFVRGGADGGWVVGSPFVNSDSFVVRVVGVPYMGTSYDLDFLRSIKKGTEDYLVVAVHMLASPKGGTMYEGEDIFKYADLGGLDPDIFLFGHWHKDQGIDQVTAGKWIVNIGSLTRGTLAQDDISRQPSVAILRFGDQIKIEQRVLDHQPAGKVFNLASRQLVEERSAQMADFVDSLQESLSNESGPSLRDAIMKFPVDPRVREKALLYLERHETA